MLECLILGDSIAVGTQHLKNECVLVGKSGINSWQWNKNYSNQVKPAETVIISLGTNDHDGVNTFRELMTMRDRIDGKRVFWILPPCNDKFCKPHVNEIVEIIAKNYGDTVIGTKKLQPDSIHPSWAGYRELAEKTR